MAESLNEGSDPYRYESNTELDEIFTGMRSPVDNRKTGDRRAWGGPIWAEVAYSRMSPEDAQTYIEYDAAHGGDLALAGIKSDIERRAAAKQEREDGKSRAGIT